MIELFLSLPSWFLMVMIASIVFMLIATGVAFVYRFVKYGADVKVGPVEIDATPDKGDKNVEHD